MGTDRLRCPRARAQVLPYPSGLTSLPLLRLCCRYTPASCTLYLLLSGCQGPAQLRPHFLQEGVSGFPGGTLHFAFSQGPSAFLVPWVSGSALSDSQSALDDRVFFCHLPGRLLRDRGARMNPSGIEEGRRLPCNPDGCTLSDFAFQRLLPHRVCSAFACSPLVMGGSSPL